jgi:hypothetical protein
MSDSISFRIIKNQNSSSVGDSKQTTEDRNFYNDYILSSSFVLEDGTTSSFDEDINPFFLDSLNTPNSRGDRSSTFENFILANRTRRIFEDIIINILNNSVNMDTEFNLTPIKAEIDLEEQCSICQSDIITNSMIYKTNCNHVYHKDCLDQWVKYKNTCPYCRAELS